MSNIERLGNSLKNIARAYIFLHLNFSLGTLNLLPDWIGYILIFDALLILKEEEESAILLQPLAILLGIWEFIRWILTLIRIEMDFYLLSVIVTVVSLYFHFQLLTNLANIAQKHECPERSKILNLRTLQTLLITLLSLPFPWDKYMGISVIILLANAAIALWITVTLYALRRSLLDDHPKNIIYCENEEEE